MIMLSGANLHLFDEPTNHLDVESIEALEDALESYDGPVIHVLDASRAVGVASNLMSETHREPLIARTADDYEALRQARSRSGHSELATLAEARANAFPYDPSGKPPAPQYPGLRQFGEWPLKDLKASIDI